jgi:hypothetical protein
MKDYKKCLSPKYESQYQDEKTSLVYYELGYNICEDQQICYEPRYWQDLILS